MKNNLIVLIFLFLILLFIFLIPSSLSLSSTGKFTISGFCGDNITGNNEECDGNNISLASCQNLGYDFGALTCTGNCTFDESQCYFSSVSADYDTGRGRQRVYRECNDGIDNDNDSFIDLNDDGCTNVLDDSEYQDVCSPRWSEDEWNNCMENSQIRRVIDINHCNSNNFYFEQKECFSLFADEENRLTLVSSGLFILALLILIISSLYKRLHKKKRHKRSSNNFK